MRWNCMSKAPHFLQITAEHQDYPFFTVFLTTKSLSQNISITLLQISLKLHKHRGGYWRKKLPRMILEEQFSVPRNTSVSKIGNSVISLLWQLRCHCNADHNKFSSLSNTTVVAFFQNFVYDDVVYAQTWEYWPWKTVSSHLNCLAENMVRKQSSGFSSSFRNLFLSSNQVHHYETRLASQYRPHFCRTNIKQFSILYRGQTIWNSLPVTLTSSSSIFVFKKKSEKLSHW